MESRTEEFKALAREGLARPFIRKAIATANGTYFASRAAAIAAVPDWAELRQRGADIKDRALERLADLLTMLEARIQARGGTVHWAGTGEEASRIVVDIARRSGIRMAIKSKSMVTEEIGLNHALAFAGVEAVESDLGEYIVQLAGETPSHIISPCIHKSRAEIAELFHRKIGSPLDATIPQMTRAARAALREKFLAAGMGVSGVNFAVAETGTLVVLENEGNARLSTTLLRVHVAIMGIEKVVERAADLEVLFKLLTRSATGQAITTYVSFIGGPRSGDEVDGPVEMHLLILDGGRSRIWADPEQRASLRCIRCGACLNYGPVYERIGVHAYGWVYPGPIGSVITPGLIGIETSRDLPRASSLCGRCGEVCPVKIPLPEMLLQRRIDDVEGRRPGPGPIPGPGHAHHGHPPLGERLSMKLFASLASSPRWFQAAAGAARIFLRLFLRRNRAPRLPGALGAWTRGRTLPRPPEESFRQAWQRISAEESHR